MGRALSIHSIDLEEGRMKRPCEPANGTRIRLMVSEDAPEVARLATQLGYPSTPEQITKRWEAIRGVSDAVALVATDPAGNVVGWIHVFATRMLESDPYAEIGGLVVDETARGLGIGATLVSAGEGWARERGYPAVRVRSNVTRTEAHEFYKRLGYEVQKSQFRFRKAL